MTILAIENDQNSTNELANTLQEVFPQEVIAAFASPLFALQYAHRHPKEIELVFTAIVMHHADGLELAKALEKCSPEAEMFFIVQCENSELAAIAKQHGNGTCLARPITAETIRQATKFLWEPCLWDDNSCG